MTVIRRWCVIVASIVLCSASVSVLSASEERHIEGQAELMLSQFDNELTIAISSPAYNIVGFEHLPESAKEFDEIAEARTKLSNADLIFQADQQAECAVKMVELRSVLLEAINQRGRRGHRLNLAEHSDTVIKPESGSGSSNKRGSKKSMGSKFKVRYLIQCEKPAMLSRVKVGLFAVFPRIKMIIVDDAEASSPQRKQLTPLYPDLVL